MKDLLQAKDAKQINLSSLIDIDRATPAQVKLSAARNLQNAATETDTYEEFLAKYNNTVNILYNESPGYQDPPGVYYYASYGLFYQNCAIIAKEDKETKITKLLSSIHFDWNKKEENLETEEITSVDECLTMSGYICYGLSPCLINSVFEINGSVTDLLSDENKLAFAYGTESYRLNDDGSKYYLGWNTGLIFTYVSINRNTFRYEDREGNTKHTLTLTFVHRYMVGITSYTDEIGAKIDYRGYFYAAAVSN